MALVRVSTDDQDVGVQRQQIDRWAAAQDPPRVVEYVEESGVSGIAKSRPGLEEIMRRVSSGSVDEVVVVALDRLGRSVVQVVTTLEAMSVRGVRVVSLRESIDFGTAAGRLQAQIISAMAEFERSLIRERTRAGMARARSLGLSVGRPSLELSEEDLATVRRLRDEGASWEKIGTVGIVAKTASGRKVRASVTTLRKAFLAAEKGKEAPATD